MRRSAFGVELSRKKRKFQTAAPIWVRRGGILVSAPNTYGAVHGKRGTYVYRKCRCAPCSAAQAAYAATYERKKRTPEDMKPRHHGTPNGYIHYNCRCRPCTDAVVAYRRKRKWQ